MIVRMGERARKQILLLPLWEGEEWAGLALP
jgi:hypothetical protein